jgi:hypothetical protein
MRKTMIAVVAMALTMAFAGVSSASAFQFSPENSTPNWSSSNVQLKGQLVSWSCSNYSASGKVTAGVIKGNGPLISGCSNTVNSEVTLVSAAGAWSLTPTSATTATLSADTTPTSGGTVLSIRWGLYNVTAKGPISIPNLPWDNAKHQLTLPAGTQLPIQTPNPLYAAYFGSSLKVEGTLQFPSNLTITP